MLAPSPPPDCDLAPPALLRLIGLGLGRQPLGGDAMASAQRPGDALAARRMRLEQLLSRQGARAILALGEGMADAPDEPALMALSAASSARDLLTRWQRLEAYAHCRQRISFRPWSDQRIEVVHQTRSMTGMTPVEDFLVYGLQTALLERVLATRVDVQISGSSRQIRREGTWLEAIPPGMQAGVEFSWTPKPGRPATPLPSSGPTRDAVRALILADPARGWTLTAVAATLCLAARTLQRRLRDEGCSFARLIHDARASHASRLLTQSHEPISMIGFVSGYADQSHFTRDFKRLTTMTPALFRTAFATTAETRDRVTTFCETRDRVSTRCSGPTAASL